MNFLGVPRKHLIYGGLTFFSVLGAIMKVTVLDGPGSGFLTWYLGFLYLVFVAWAIGELRKIQRREQEERAAPPEGVAAASLSLMNPPAEEALISAETYLSLGESLDTVCQFVEPRYRDWSASEKQAFRSQLRAAIDERRAKAG